MKLSTAIMLGDTMKRCDPAQWISQDGSCGCALGGALLAAGVTTEQFRSEWEPGTGVRGFAEMPLLKRLWPWLTVNHVADISLLYNEVQDGEKTIEDVAAYVASVEPAEAPESYSGDQGDEQEPEWSDWKAGIEREHSITGR